MRAVGESCSKIEIELVARWATTRKRPDGWATAERGALPPLDGALYPDGASQPVAASMA
ncbi:MAG: hypothetical protein NTV21_19435 [Planctomycetota bacterium]|nr:hypothetical protein [Planctomycetota bacterium]